MLAVVRLLHNPEACAIAVWLTFALGHWEDHLGDRFQCGLPKFPWLSCARRRRRWLVGLIADTAVFKEGYDLEAMRFVATHGSLCCVWGPSGSELLGEQLVIVFTTTRIMGYSAASNVSTLSKILLSQRQHGTTSKALWTQWCGYCPIEVASISFISL